MGILAVIIAIVFLGIGLGLRGWFFKRRTGYDVIAGFLKKRHGVELVAGKCIALGFIAIVTGAVLDAVGILGRVPGIGSRSVAIAGLVIAVLGFALSQWSVSAMGDSWRVDVSDEDVAAMITTGPFGVCRNPIYTSIMVVAVGAALMVPNWVTLAGVPMVLLSFELMVRRVEEPFMSRSHGDEFARYASRVGRFAPYIGRMRNVRNGDD